MKLVFTAAVMDLCHEGHINLMREMRQEAGRDGKVLVILHDDKSIYETKGKIPIQSLAQRIENIRIVGLVDEILTSSNYRHLARTFEYVIHEYWNYDKVFMRGDDWEQFPARATLKTWNIPIKFIPYTKGVSSTLLREEIRREGT